MYLNQYKANFDMRDSKHYKIETRWFFWAHFYPTWKGLFRVHKESCTWVANNVP